MNIKQALSILCPNAASEDGLKEAYRIACKKYHPDLNPQGLEMMQLINAAYEVLKKSSIWWTNAQAREAKKETTLTETLQAKWNSVSHLPGIEGELIGSWLWITGDTKKHKDILKSQGFRYSANKTAWYYHEDKFKKRSKNGASWYAMRAMYSSQDLEKEQINRLQA